MYLKQNMPGVAYGLRLTGLRGVRRRPLGCAACAGARRLGQDVYDPVTGTYGSSLPSQDNPVYSPPPVFGPPAPTPADIAYDQAWMAGRTAPPAYNPLTSLTLPTMPSAPSAPVQAAPIGAAPVASTLSAYLPYIVLGLGGIAVIAVLKRH